MRFSSTIRVQTMTALQGTLRWKSHPRTSKTRHGALKRLEAHTVTLVGDEVYVLGGYTGTQAVNPSYTFSLSKQEWKALPGFECRYHHCCALAYDKLYVFGGYRNETTAITIEAYDLVLNSTHIVHPCFHRGYLKSIFVEDRNEIVMLTVTPAKPSVITFNVLTQQIATYNRMTGRLPESNDSLEGIVESDRKIFVIANRAKTHVQLCLVTLRMGFSAHWETVETKYMPRSLQFGPAIHDMDGLIIMYGGRGPFGESVNSLMFCDRRSKEIVSVGPYSTSPFSSKGRWPRPDRSLGSVVYGGRLIVFTWTKNQDMVDLDISIVR